MTKEVINSKDLENLIRTFTKNKEDYKILRFREFHKK